MFADCVCISCTSMCLCGGLQEATQLVKVPALVNSLSLCMCSPFLPFRHAASKCNEPERECCGASVVRSSAVVDILTFF